MQAGSYAFVLPMSYFPKYQGHQKPGDNRVQKKDPEALIGELKEDQSLTYSYRVTIDTKSALSKISHPPKCEVETVSNQKVVIQNLEGLFENLKKDIKVYFKTADMDKPVMHYQKSDLLPGYVACMAQFTATFGN